MVVLPGGARRCCSSVFVVSQVVQDDPMFDLALLRKPTFTGGLIAAFGVSASVFSLLTYLVIYVQNVLGYSAVEAGVRFLFLSGAAFVAAAIAGRLTEKRPGQVADRPGLRRARRGAAAHPRHRGRLLLDPPDPRSARQRGRRRHDQHPARLDRGRRGDGRPLRAWPRASTPRSGRSASPPASPCSARSSPTRSPTAIRAGLAGTPAADQSDRIAGAVTGGQTDAVHPGRSGRRPGPAGRRRHVELRRRAQPHHDDRAWCWRSPPRRAASC